MDVDLAVIVELEKDKQRSQERCHYSSFSEFDQLKGHLIGYFRSGSYAAIRLVHDDDKIAKKHFRKLSRAVRELRYDSDSETFEGRKDELLKRYLRLTDVIPIDPPVGGAETVSRDSAACLMLIENPGITKQELAPKLEVSEKTLQPSRTKSAMPKFHSAWEALHANDRGSGLVNRDGSVDEIYVDRQPDI